MGVAIGITRLYVSFQITLVFLVVGLYVYVRAYVHYVSCVICFDVRNKYTRHAPVMVAMTIRVQRTIVDALVAHAQIVG